MSQCAACALRCGGARGDAVRGRGGGGRGGEGAARTQVSAAVGGRGWGRLSPPLDSRLWPVTANVLPAPRMGELAWPSNLSQVLAPSLLCSFDCVI